MSQREQPLVGAREIAPAPIPSGPLARRFATVGAGTDIPFAVVLASGDIIRHGSASPAFTITFRTRGAQRRLLAFGYVGLLEAYFDGSVDVGSGWGGLLFHAREHYGALGTGINTTTEQVAETRAEIARRGLGDELRVIEADFREIPGQYHKLLSIGTLEHAGPDGLREDVRAHADALKPGGLGVIHFIGHVGTRDTEFFIRQYIFPGGWIPSLAAALATMERCGLEVLDVENLRRHDALTLDCWGERFDRNWETIHALDPRRFDERFRPVWRSYLWSCAEVFRSRVVQLNLFQVTVAGLVEAEGMVPYVALADATLAEGAMPAVVPQLKSITLGGAVAGVGIEASSFRAGLVHDSIVALEVLTGDGRIVRCTPDNEHRDLFHGFPNSYGTLGYALAVTARPVPVRSCVHLEHVRFSDPAACFEAIGRHCRERSLDFVDGTVFAPDEMYLTLGRFTDDPPWLGDYTYEHIYFRSIRERTDDYLSIRDYLWRWDTDWFWCSKNVHAQHPLVRRLLGRQRLNSITYQRIMRWNSRWGITRALGRLRGLRGEPVIQDVDIPLGGAAEFLAFLHREVGILPIWLCPIRAPDAARRFPLYPLRPGTVYVNFGFWDVVSSREPRSPGFLNRRIERKVAELSGLKSLYSDSFYTEEEFWATYGGTEYRDLKARYDPAGALPDLFAKCVHGATPVAR